MTYLADDSKPYVSLLDWLRKRIVLITGSLWRLSLKSSLRPRISFSSGPSLCESAKQKFTRPIFIVTARLSPPTTSVDFQLKILQEQHSCPRCYSTITNSWNFCKYCHRDWNRDGTLRNTPVGGGACKKAKRCCTVTSTTSNINANTSASQDYPLHETPVSRQFCGGGNGKGNNGILSVPTVEDPHRVFPTNELSETCPEYQKPPIFGVKPGADSAAGRFHHHIINASSPGSAYGEGSSEDGGGPFHTIQVDESDDVPRRSIESDLQTSLASTSTAVASDWRDEPPPSDRSEPPHDRSPSNIKNAAKIAQVELGDTSTTSIINANAKTSGSQDYPLLETPVSGQFCGGGNRKGNNRILLVPTVKGPHRAFPTNELSETCPEYQKKPIFGVKPGPDSAAGRFHHHIINASSPGSGRGEGSSEDGGGPCHTIQVDESDDVPLRSMESDPQASLAMTSVAVASDQRDETPPSDRSQPLRARSPSNTQNAAETAQEEPGDTRDEPPPSERSQPPRDRSPSNTQNAAAIAQEERGWDLYDLVKIFLPISAALGCASFAVRYGSGKSPSEKAKILQSSAAVCSVVAFLLLVGGYFISERADTVGRRVIVGGVVFTTIAFVLLMGSLLADI